MGNVLLLQHVFYVSGDRRKKHKNMHVELGKKTSLMSHFQTFKVHSVFSLNTFIQGSVAAKFKIEKINSIFGSVYRESMDTLFSPKE